MTPAEQRREITERWRRRARDREQARASLESERRLIPGRQESERSMLRMCQASARRSAAAFLDIAQRFRRGDVEAMAKRWYDCWARCQALPAEQERARREMRLRHERERRAAAATAKAVNRARATQEKGKWQGGA
jgi:hypothetical protein